MGEGLGGWREGGQVRGEEISCVHTCKMRDKISSPMSEIFEMWCLNAQTTQLIIVLKESVGT